MWTMDLEDEKMRVKAVLFDLGGTLIKTADIPEIFKRILENYGVNVPIDEIREAHRGVEESEVVEGMLEGGQDFWIGWNLKVLEEVGLQADRDFLAKKIDELWWEYADLEIYPEVMETLAQLRAKGVKTGVITNGLKRDYEQILDKLKLTNFFDVVVGIDTLNKAKPDKEIFLHAVDMLGVRPKQAVFIGDSVRYDYEGAKKAGLKPLLIDRQGQAPENVETIRSLTEVLPYV